MSIQQILGELPASQFVEQFYQKIPYSRSQGARQFTRLDCWKLLEQILASGRLEGRDASRETPDLVVARQDRFWQGDSLPTFDEARRLHQDGFTVLVRHAEQCDQQLGQLAAGFRADFGAPVNIHVYFTPAAEYGFGWHYDAEEVFIIQTEGKKEFQLRKNTVHPWPLVETIPANMAYEREIMPLLRCPLSPGDWLYIPCGYWHRAEAQQDSVSLAIGLMAPAAIDVLQFLRHRLLDSLMWRQRLPPTGSASPLDSTALKAEYRRLLEALARDLERTLRDEAFLRDFLERNPAAPGCQAP